MVSTPVRVAVWLVFDLNWYFIVQKGEAIYVQRFFVALRLSLYMSRSNWLQGRFQ